MHALVEHISARHRAAYGLEPSVLAYAPGRVEILGNHTDYNEGFVLSAAVDAGIAFALSPVEGDVCILTSADFGETVRFQAIEPGRTDAHRWSNYSRGVLTFLRERYGFRPRAFAATQAGDIPVAAGLSSSAALEIASGLAFSSFFGVAPEKIELAKIGQRAEHEFAGVRCGLLDQISSLFGRDQSLVLTDFRSLEVSAVPLPDGLAFMVADTGVKHTLVDSEYNERRERCEQAAAALARILGPRVKTLRDVSREEMKLFRDRLDPSVWKRAAHPVGENERVTAGTVALRAGKGEVFGRLMFESHESSRTLFENSCPELDALVDAARSIPGVYGARLTGGGFGGSIVALIETKKAAGVSEGLAAAYRSAFGRTLVPRIIIPSAGARLIRP